MDCMECIDVTCRRKMGQKKKEAFLDGYREGVDDAKKRFQTRIDELENDRELDWSPSIYVIEDCIKQKLVVDAGVLFYTNWKEALEKQGELTRKNGCIYRVVEYSRHVS